MKQFQLNAAARLTQVLAKEDNVPSEWWHHLPAEQKKQYIEEHPQSKYADQAIKEGEEAEEHGEPQKKIPQEHREKAAADIRSNSGKIARTLKKTFPLISEATSALKHLVTGKPLEEEHKEALHELGGVALKTALSSAIGPHGAMVVGQIGITATKYAIDHFSEKKKEAKNKDDVEVFVDTLADGVEHAEEAPVPKEHAESGSHYRGAIAKHVKASAGHIVKVLDKSFKHIKPATQGLVALSHGKPLTEEHKKAVKGIGKIALGLSIAALPGGLAAHLAAGVGATALAHAYKAIKDRKLDPQHIVHSFVESIGEGLEHGLLESVGESGEGGGGE
jgi:hypothetical protein